MDGITKQDIAEVRKAIVKCQEWGECLQRNASCGMDCQSQMDEQRMAMEYLTKVNQLYGPQFPTKG